MHMPGDSRPSSSGNTSKMEDKKEQDWMAWNGKDHMIVDLCKQMQNEVIIRLYDLNVGRFYSLDFWNYGH